jgi:hypothetical protein
MGTYRLIPKEPDPLTGLQNGYVAWHFIQAESSAVNDAIIWLKNYQGWDYHLFSNPDKPDKQRLSLAKALGNVDTGALVNYWVDDTQWFMFDNGFINVLNDDVVQTNYDISDYTLPPPPPPPEPEPLPPPPGNPNELQVVSSDDRFPPPAVLGE